MQLTIVVQGIEQLSAKFAAVVSPETLRAPLLAAQKLLQERMAHYPPPRPSSSYERTGDLGAGWTTEAPDVQGFGLNASLVNQVSYAPFVQSEEQQAAIHRGYWQTDAQVLEASVEEIGMDFLSAIENALEK